MRGYVSSLLVTCGLRDYGTATWEGGDPECDHALLNRGAKGNGGEKSTLSGAGAPYHDEDRAKRMYKGTCGKCGARRIDQGIGLEPDPGTWAARLVEVFREVRRVLHPSGTVFCNIGDAYAQRTVRHRNDQRNYGDGSERRSDGWIDNGRSTAVGGLKPKDLIGLPWLLAFALRADGWYLRSDIIWAKPNPMPESVTDRPTNAHEHLFLLSKRPTYFYDAEAVKESVSSFSTFTDAPLSATPWAMGTMRNDKVRLGNGSRGDASGRNRRNVWTIATEPYPEAHFATFPTDLVKPCVLAGTSERGVCPECGAPWVRMVEPGKRAEGGKPYRNGDPRGIDRRCTPGGQKEWDAHTPARVLGWRLGCSHGLDPVPAVVLDPFSGSGTTGLVALQYGRSYVGVELNPEYVAMSEKRLHAAKSQEVLALT